LKLSNIFKHLWLITKHRHRVFLLCTKCGLFWRGLLHDLSKYSCVEFWESAKFYTGYRSPISICREVKGYSLAWLHHKGRNRHHIEYWYDEDSILQAVVPYKFAVEGICDKIVATKIYRGKSFELSDVLLHWNRMKSKLHANEKVLQFYDKVLTDLKDYGEKYVENSKYLKKTYTEICEK